MKHANFQLLLLLAVPSSILKFENQASPVAFPKYPPSLNPIFTSSLSLLLNINSTSCQSCVPDIAIDLSVVPSTAICAPIP